MVYKLKNDPANPKSLIILQKSTSRIKLAYLFHQLIFYLSNLDETNVQKIYISKISIHIFIITVCNVELYNTQKYERNNHTDLTYIYTFSI